MDLALQIKNQVSKQFLPEKLLRGSRKGTKIIIVKNYSFIVCHFWAELEVF